MKTLNLKNNGHSIKNNKTNPEADNTPYSNEELKEKSNADKDNAFMTLNYNNKKYKSNTAENTVGNTFITTIQNIINEGHKQAHSHTIRNTIIGSAIGGASGAIIGAGGGAVMSSILSKKCNNNIQTAEELLQQQNQLNISSNTKELLRYLEENPQTEQEKILENMKTNITKCEKEKDNLEKKQQDLIEQKKDLEDELYNKTITKKEYDNKIHETNNKIENITNAINITEDIIEHLWQQYNRAEENRNDYQIIEKNLSQSLTELQNCTKMDDKITILQNVIKNIQTNITKNKQTLDHLNYDNRYTEYLLDELQRLQEKSFASHTTILDTTQTNIPTGTTNIKNEEDLEICLELAYRCVNNFKFNRTLCDTYTKPKFGLWGYYIGDILYARDKDCLNETFTKRLVKNNNESKTLNETINNDTLTIQSHQQDINQTKQEFEAQNCKDKPFKNETLKDAISAKINNTKNQLKQQNETLEVISQNLTDFQNTLKNLKEEDIDAIIANLKNLTQQQNITNNEIIENQYNINQTNSQIDNITNLIEEKNKTCEEQKQEYIDKSNYFASLTQKPTTIETTTINEIKTTAPTSITTYNTNNITGNNTIGTEQQCVDNKNITIPSGVVSGLALGALLGAIIAYNNQNKNTMITEDEENNFYIPIDGKGKLSQQALNEQEDREYIKLWFTKQDNKVKMKCKGTSDQALEIEQIIKNMQTNEQTKDFVKQAFKNLNKKNKTEASLLAKINKCYKKFKNTTNDDIVKIDQNVLPDNAKIQTVEMKNLENVNKNNKVKLSNV